MTMAGSWVGMANATRKKGKNIAPNFIKVKIVEVVRYDVGGRRRSDQTHHRHHHRTYPRADHRTFPMRMTRMISNVSLLAGRGNL